MTKTMLIATIILSLALAPVIAYNFDQTNSATQQGVDIPFAAEAATPVSHEIWMEAVKMPDEMYA